jgi:Fe-S cluster assembly protein SufD
MAEVKEYQDVYLASFERREKELAAAGPSWLHEIRKSSLHRFAELGFPTTQLEDWKYTSVDRLASVPFQPAPDGPAGVIIEALKGLPLCGLDCSRLVFVNGHYQRELSGLTEFSQGVRAGSLAEALANGAPALEQHLARYADFENHAFVALNTAFLHEGAFVEIPPGLMVEKPIVLLYISTARGQPTASHPRTLILAGRESQATLIEGYLGVDEELYFTNAVTEIVAGENAVLEYGKFQQESRAAFHLATVRVEQARSSNVSTYSFAFGGALAREDLSVVLAGEGAESALHGLYMTTGQQHVDNHTTLDHARPHSSSRELYKGVLDGQSTAVFHGRVMVRQDAQKTDSKQSNKNLLLSEEAVINTKPQLEIFADDVKCTHGATVGQVDPEAIFYLRSRGIAREAARALLTFAFANEVIERVKYGPMRDRLKDALLARLGAGLRREAA